MAIALCGCDDLAAMRSALGAGASRPRCFSLASRWRLLCRDSSPPLRGTPPPGARRSSLKEGVQMALALCGPLT